MYSNPMGVKQSDPELYAELSKQMEEELVRFYTIKENARIKANQGEMAQSLGEKARQALKAETEK